MLEANVTAPYLLRQRRFCPLFLTQFLGAFNDNIYKNALVIFITFNANPQLQERSAILVSLAAGVFILPFFLFSAIAGQLADKFEKSALIVRVKQVEIVIMGLAGLGFLLDNVMFLMLVLFAMGAQSSLFGPLKYSILPQHLARHELTTGNGLVQMATFLAILLGTMLGGFLMAMQPSGSAVISVTVVLVAVAGLVISRTIPLAGASAPGLRLRWNLLAETATIVRHARESRAVFSGIIGISWFWFVGATFLQLLPSYTRDVLHGDANVVTLMLTAFSVGIGLGSLLCAKLSSGQFELKLVPVGGFGLALFCVTLMFVGPAAGTALPAGQYYDLGQFWALTGNWWVFIDLVAVSVFGGLYIVPLFVFVQSRSLAARRARVIAANNVFNALFMVGSALTTIALLSAGWRADAIIALTGVITAVVTLRLCYRKGDGLLRDAAPTREVSRS